MKWYEIHNWMEKYNIHVPNHQPVKNYVRHVWRNAYDHVLSDQFKSLSKYVFEFL